MAAAVQDKESKKRVQEDEVLSVLTDEANGREYYVSMIDTFEFQKREYAVMYNVRSEDDRRHEAEIVIMRTYRDKDGSRYFSSLRSRRELAIVFELFYQRYYNAKQEGERNAF